MCSQIHHNAETNYSRFKQFCLSEPAADACMVLLRYLRGFFVLALASGRGLLEVVFKTLARSRLGPSYTAGRSAWSERKVCQSGFWLWTIIS
jgi:hypothetical protein